MRRPSCHPAKECEENLANFIRDTRREFKGNVLCVETRGFLLGYPSHHNYRWNGKGETYYLV